MSSRSLDPRERSSRKMDRVAAAGAVIALAGCLLLPVAVLRPNRIVSGVAYRLPAAGLVGWALAVVSALALVAALSRPGRRRVVFELAAGCGMMALLPWVLGRTAVRLLAGAVPFARVSIGSGMWLALTGAAVVWFAAFDARPKRSELTLASVIAVSAWSSAAIWGGLGHLSVVAEYDVQAAVFWQAVGTHLYMVGISLAIAIALGVPLGAAALRSSWIRTPVLGVIGVIQTVPSLALLGLLVLPLAALGLPGIGPLPGVIALTLYALLPIVRNTYVGLAGVDPAIVDAGRGMGMNRGQLLLRVEAPLALPLVVEGVRTAAVLVIGIATLVAFVAVPTLGLLVFEGWGQQADDLIMLGAIPIVVLAVIADAGLRWLGRAMTSPGIRREAG